MLDGISQHKGCRRNASFMRRDPQQQDGPPNFITIYLGCNLLCMNPQNMFYSRKIETFQARELCANTCNLATKPWHPSESQRYERERSAARAHRSSTMANMSGSGPSGKTGQNQESQKGGSGQHSQQGQQGQQGNRQNDTSNDPSRQGKNQPGQPSHSGSGNK
jgi:hypothetical protein